MMRLMTVCVVLFSTTSMLAADPPSAQQLAKWLKRFPKADANGDGKLTAQEAAAYWKSRRSTGVVKTIRVDPGWNKERFPDHAVCYKNPDQIAAVLREVLKQPVKLASYPKPDDGSLRIVGTGNYFIELSG